MTPACTNDLIFEHIRVELINFLNEIERKKL
jgi:hypothetical protein